MELVSTFDGTRTEPLLAKYNLLSLLIISKVRIAYVEKKTLPNET